MKIYLLRHLPTEFNVIKRYMGQSYDKPILSSIVPEFEQFLTRLSLDLPPESIVLSSPLQRCVDTLGIFSRHFGLSASVKTDQAFIETNYGDFEGLSKKEVTRQFPQVWDDIHERPLESRLPNGESFKEVSVRSIEGLDKIISTYPEESTIVLCSHVDIIKALIFNVLGTTFQFKKNLYIDNGSISCLSIEKGIKKVKFVNQAPILTKFKV